MKPTVKHLGKIILTASLALTLLTGCWDRREINDVAFVVASAFDKVEDGYLISVQIPLPGQLGGIGGSGGGGGTSGEKSWYIDSAVGKTIRDANSKQQTTLSRQLYFAHRRVLLLGEELARDGVAPVLDVLARISQNRLTAFPLVTKGEAREVMGANTPIEAYPAEMIRELAQGSMKSPRTLRHMVEIMLTDGIDIIIPAVRRVETRPPQKEDIKKTIKLDGFAVFSGDKLAGFLNREESSSVLLAMNQAKIPKLSAPPPDGEGLIEYMLQENKMSLIPIVKGDEITMRLEFRAKGIIVENSSNYDLSANANLVAFEELVAKKLTQDIKKAIDALQNKYHSDVIGFGDSLYRKDPDAWNRVKQNWREENYPKVHVQVIPLVHFEHTGATTKPLGIKDRGLIR
ncbi:hypothetical protein CBW65_18785 [Tumebacillus avium]|uniref:Uncharacterized protein n=1 Tax=Tumebacillus avium TaxID=1903704 RepID=A0A1Y0IQE3_9BACL|nr:Ger(x)C family spore germination protein [Tumebacillus avium]ARU62788.1 hypothetical protein CBW65_18785 [Tumebacillus avium]